MLSKIERQKNNRIYGNAANQVFRSSSDDDANMRIFFEYFLLFYLILCIIFFDNKAGFQHLHKSLLSMRSQEK